MRKIIALLTALFITCSLFAYEGYLKGAKGPLKVIKTEYFDIIFPEDCRSSAEQIAEVADDYYREIAEKLGYEPYQRFPVTLTNQVESPNAFFTLAPYNMIVYFDTEQTEDLDMYENTVQKVFYHELTHAVSLNSKAAFWRGMSVFADVLTPAGISLTSFWYEGVTVSFESAGKGGRLNDPFFTQIVVEAKVKDLRGEKSFPSWRDVTGVTDVYPYGSEAYDFGACFAEYLQDTYGMEKYAEFWRRAGTWTSFSFCAGVFKKTYGRNISDVWEEFYQSIPVPENVVNLEPGELLSWPDSAVRAVDFVKDSAGKSHIVWNDSLSTAVFLDGKKLFTCTGIISVFFVDEKNIYVERLVDRDNTKREDFIYNLETGKSRRVKRNDTVNNGESITTGKGWNASILKEGLTWSIVFTPDSKENRAVKYTFPQTFIHRVHFVEETDSNLIFNFVWADVGEGGLFKSSSETSFSRIGRIIIDKRNYGAKIQLQEKDNYAGVIDAVWSGKGEGEYLAVFQEYRSTPLRKIFVDWNNIELKNVAGEEIVWLTEEETVAVQKEAGDNSTDSITFDETSYNGLRYFFRGIKVPLGTVNAKNHDFEDAAWCWLGGTFISSTNWLSTFTNFSAGYDIFDKVGGVSLSVAPGDSDTEVTLSGTCIFDGNGFLQTSANASIAQVLYQGKYSSVAAGVNAIGINGGEDPSCSEKVEIGSDKYKSHVSGLSAQGSGYLLYSNLHRIKPGFGQVLGFYLKPFVTAQYDDLKTEYDGYDGSDIYKKRLFNAGGTLGIRLPGLFPVQAEGSLFPQTDVFAKGFVKVVFYDIELHKGIGGISMFMQRLNFYGMYEGTSEYSSSESWDIARTDKVASDLKLKDYSDSIRFAAELTLCPNTSYFASSSNTIGVGYTVAYSFNGESKNKLSYGMYLNVAR